MKTIKALSLLACLTGVSTLVAAQDNRALESGHEYMVALNFPNNLHVIDTATDRIYKSCDLPDAYGPGTAQVSPDGKIAYILNNHYGDLYGVDMDSCETVFHARLAINPNESARAMFSIAVSRDGKEIYSVANPSTLYSDHMKAQPPRLQVYAADGGLQAKPTRTFEVPRQISILMAADDGSLYMAGVTGIFKNNVHTGKYTMAVATREWKRPGYGAPDILYVWPHQTDMNDFTLLYTAPKFKDSKQDLQTADYVYGYISIDLKTGRSTVKDFAPFTEIYFTGLRSPKHPGQIYGVLNKLARYDIKSQKLLGRSDLDHTYYCVAFNKSGSKLYLGGSLDDIAVFDPETLKPLGKIQLPGGDMSDSTLQVFVRQAHL